MTSRASKDQQALRDFAMGYPEAHEDFPWGERVVKVKGKVFLFLGGKDHDLSLSVKLPASGLVALGLPFASPTGYGLGKSGWVSARFSAGDKPPLDLLRAWIDESYRAVAPKKLLASLPAGPPAGAPRARPAAKSPAARARRAKARR
ncbi:MAG TPA: MmcQ/YjbR family DNA-binding protein [Vicinamibacteria bacterium]